MLLVLLCSTGYVVVQCQLFWYVFPLFGLPEGKDDGHLYGEELLRRDTEFLFGMFWKGQMILIPDIIWAFYTDEYLTHFWYLSVTNKQLHGAECGRWELVRDKYLSFYMKSK